MLITVYKLFIEEQDKFYIGSCMNIKHRFNLHKYNTNHLSSPLYSYFKFHGVDKLKIVCIYKEECNSEKDKKNLEQEFIDHYYYLYGDKLLNKKINSINDRKFYMRNYMRNYNKNKKQKVIQS